MVIVSFLSLDQKRETFIPELSSLSKAKKAELYWKCAAVFFSTSIRCNQNVRHIFYTDSTKTVIVDGINIIEYLQNLGVEIRILSFKRFVPPDNYSRIFQSGFYKFDVLKALEAENETKFIVLDIDCIWTKYDKDFFNLVKKEELLLYDVFEQIPPDEKISRLSRSDMGTLFRKIVDDYPDDKPIRFGGEFLACDLNTLKTLNSKAHQLFHLIISRFGNNPPRFRNRKRIFDGNEPFGSLLLNHGFVPWKDAQGFIKRIYSSTAINTVLPEDLDIPIWHMPDEKKHGIPLLFTLAVNNQSEFWSTPLEHFNVLLGGYLGVPVRIHRSPWKFNLNQQLINKIRYYYRIYFS
ncbi:MAG: hypothetical protein V3W20_11835 [Candidatus Neomarinimicrobiota bacterium]|jgi:hypothetical protein